MVAAKKVKEMAAEEAKADEGTFTWAAAIRNKEDEKSPVVIKEGEAKLSELKGVRFLLAFWRDIPKPVALLPLPPDGEPKIIRRRSLEVAGKESKSGPPTLFLGWEDNEGSFWIAVEGEPPTVSINVDPHN